MIKRKDNELYQKLNELIKSEKIEDIETSIEEINNYLDELKLTAIDIRKPIDTSQIEDMNQYKGL